MIVGVEERRHKRYKRCRRDLQEERTNLEETRSELNQAKKKIKTLEKEVKERDRAISKHDDAMVIKEGEVSISSISDLPSSRDARGTCADLNNGHSTSGRLTI